MARGSINDGAVDVVDFRDVRVHHREGGIGGGFHLSAKLLEGVDGRLADFEAVGLGAGVEVEGAAIGNVTRHLSKTGRGDCDVAPVNERGHVDEAHAVGMGSIPLHKGFDEAAGRIDAHPCLGLGALHPAQLDRRGGQGDHAMPAVVAVSLVVQEDDAKVCCGGDGWREVTAVHVGVPTGLEHQRLANVIGMLQQPRAAFHDGVAGQLGQARGDDAKRLSAGVHFHSADGACDLHGECGVMPQ